MKKLFNFQGIEVLLFNKKYIIILQNLFRHFYTAFQFVNDLA